MKGIFLLAFVLVNAFVASEAAKYQFRVTVSDYDEFKEPREETSLEVQNTCDYKTNCSSCIQTEKCAWCTQPDFGYGPRCFQSDMKVPMPCPEEFVVNPSNEQNLISNNALRKNGQILKAHEAIGNESHKEAGSEQGSTENVQISPQHVQLKLRMNEKLILPFDFAQTEDYPFDLYFLVSSSKSMEDDKEKVAHLAESISENLMNITTDFRLGFGSFVDKPLMPFVSTVPKKLEEPCNGCEPPYSFRNVMSLSSDTNSFVEKVRNANISGKLSAPGGNLDAIMQAIVCTHEIGWRLHARRLLVVVADSSFRLAGDGKLGGVLKPNDGQCHMTDGMYTHSMVQDYPSVSQINQKVRQYSINIIFAVSPPQIDLYKELSEQIEGSYTAVLSDNPSNVVELIRYEYNKISSYVEFRDNSHLLRTHFYSRCFGYERRPTNKCYGLKVGDTVSFEAEIYATSCPENPANRRQTFKIYPIGNKQALTVDVELICSCGCETSGLTFEERSPRCSGVGTLSCGICECGDGYFGRNCECANYFGLETNSCRHENSTEIECSGRGTCICGGCHCNLRSNPEETISGKFCECDNFSCDRHNSLLCSGPDHGTCSCGMCMCRDGWSGSACECSTSTETCKTPDGKICGGHGFCRCGQCFEGDE